MFKLCYNAIDYISRRSGCITLDMQLEPCMGG
jgi:hypothetical protein